MERALQKRKVSPRLAFAVALLAAAVPGLCVLGPWALYLTRSVEEGEARAARALSYLACAELGAAAVALLLKAVS